MVSKAIDPQPEIFTILACNWSTNLLRYWLSSEMEVIMNVKTERNGKDHCWIIAYSVWYLRNTLEALSFFYIKWKIISMFNFCRLGLIFQNVLGYQRLYLKTINLIPIAVCSPDSSRGGDTGRTRGRWHVKSCSNIDTKLLPVYKFPFMKMRLSHDRILSL